LVTGTAFSVGASVAVFVEPEGFGEYGCGEEDGVCTVQIEFEYFP
jgi:hypothetical protein